MVEGKNLGLDFPVLIMNVYGPYSHKQVFWERIRDGSLLNHQRLIWGGDLNLTLSDVDVWGAGRINYTLHDLFNSSFERDGLIDIEPNILVLTLSTGRYGSEGIAKRLDRFLMTEFVCNSLGRFRYW